MVTFDVSEIFQLDVSPSDKVTVVRAEGIFVFNPVCPKVKKWFNGVF